MQKILVPFDFSTYSEYALKFAHEYASNTKGKIKLLHVVEHNAYGGISAAGEIPVMESFENDYFSSTLKNSKKRLKEKIESKEFKNVDIDFEVRVGSAFNNIVTEITEYKADIIIMGTKGASGLEEFFIGSNAEKIVRFAKCPVITIPSGANFDTIRNIAFAINFEDEQKQIVELLKSYQKIFSATLNLVWVNTQQIEESDDLIIDKLDRFAEEYGIENYKTHTYKAATAEQGILNFSVAKNMDMIALATHGFKGLTHLFLGSVAEDVVNHSKIPVWTFSMKGIN